VLATPLLVMMLAGLALSWMFASCPPSQAVTPFRVVTAGLLLFFAPGLLLTQILGLRRMPWLAAMAVAAAMSMCFAAVLLPVPFLLAGSIRTYTGLYLAVLICLSTIAVVMARRKSQMQFDGRGLRSLSKAPSAASLFHFGVITLIAAGAYGFGEQVWDIGHEKLQHLQFIRLYFERTAQLSNLGVLPNVLPPNVIYFWEYMIAAWATAIHADPLPLFEHVRFIIPLVGLPAMYLLAWAIFSTRRANQCFSVILLLVLGAIFLVKPTTLDFVNVADPTRGAFLFYGTAHHADAAMDILMPMLTALLWLSLSSRRWLWRILLLGMLLVAFLWHPREYFQLAITALMVALAFWLSRRAAPRVLFRRTLWVGAALALIAVVFSVAMKNQAMGKGGYDELQIKKTALSVMTDRRMLLGIRDAFAFPTHFVFASSEQPDKILTTRELLKQLNGVFRKEAWLLLAGVAQLVLVVAGTRRARALATVHMLFWGMLLWNAACALAIAITYSEILHTTPRLLYVFSYVVIAEGMLVLAQYGVALARRIPRVPVQAAAVILLVGMLTLGYLFGLRRQWMTDHTMKVLSMLIGPGIAAGLLLVIFNKLANIARPSGRLLRSSLIVVISAAFLLPAFWPEFVRTIRLFAPQTSHANKGIAWFSADNPFELSVPLIAAVRGLPPGAIVAAAPADSPYFSVYAPVYTLPSPLGIMLFQDEAYAIRAGTHPLFGTGLPSAEEMRQYLWSQHVDYLAIQRTHFARLMPTVLTMSDCLQAVVLDDAAKEGLFRVCRDPRRSN
jgi:hypothetical protein